MKNQRAQVQHHWKIKAKFATAFIGFMCGVAVIEDGVESFVRDSNSIRAQQSAMEFREIGANHIIRANLFPEKYATDSAAIDRRIDVVKMMLLRDVELFNVATLPKATQRYLDKCDWFFGLNDIKPSDPAEQLKQTPLKELKNRIENSGIAKEALLSDPDVLEMASQIEMKSVRYSSYLNHEMFLSGINSFLAWIIGVTLIFISANYVSRLERKYRRKENNLETSKPELLAST